MPYPQTPKDPTSDSPDLIQDREPRIDPHTDPANWQPPNPPTDPDLAWIP